MTSRQQQRVGIRLPAFARPFVTRSLRGARKRHYLLLSALLALLCATVGTWLALGSGDLERDARITLGLEASTLDHRERLEFVLFARDTQELERLEATQRRLEPGELWPEAYGDWVRLGQMQTFGRNMLEWAALSERAAKTDADRRLSREARRRLVALGWVAPRAEPPSDEWVAPLPFDWEDEHDVQALRSILDRDLQVDIQLYSSPLGLREALRLSGLLAGMLLSILLLVVAPVAVGVQQAQEVHENTLGPLRIAALSARELCLGLAAGPLTVVGILALPQLLICTTGCLVAGRLQFLLALLITLGVTSIGLSLLAQLFGQILGRHRTPGMVGITLLVGSAGGWAASLWLAFEPASSVQAELALAPHASAFLALGFAFALPQLHGWMLEPMTLRCAGVGVLAMVILSFVFLRALEQQVAEREGPVLDLGTGLLGLAACAGPVFAATLGIQSGGVPSRLYLHEPEFCVSNLALLAPAFALFVMSQVPVGGAPSGRTVPVARILASLALALGLHFSATGVALVGGLGEILRVFQPYPLLYLSWAALVLGLLSIRIVAYPLGLMDRLVALLVAACIVHAAIQGGEWGVMGVAADDPLFSLSSISPVLGGLQAAWMVAIPVLLLWALRQNVGAIATRDPRAAPTTR